MSFIACMIAHKRIYRGQASRSSEKHGQASRDWNLRARVLQWLR